jgi:hypothetical protein
MHLYLWHSILSPIDKCLQRVAYLTNSLEVVSKPHLRPNGCVAPQAGFASDFLDQGAAQASDKCSHTHVCCAFSIDLRLALEPDLRF